ncbi:hypothetical protein D9M71_756310 [compost metagenome]
MKMITSTPTQALIASSRITPISITSRVEKPTTLHSRAMEPGTNSRRKVAFAASMLESPWRRSATMVLIFWIAWLTPMAKVRNGTRVE